MVWVGFDNPIVLLLLKIDGAPAAPIEARSQPANTRVDGQKLVRQKKSIVYGIKRLDVGSQTAAVDVYGS
jgi:hypothetical protein